MNTDKYNQKALGDPLKGGSRRVRKASTARFDPKAVDGDNDGVVQEGTQFARPAAPSIKKPRTLVGKIPSTKPSGMTSGKAKVSAELDKFVGAKKIEDMPSFAKNSVSMVISDRGVNSETDSPEYNLFRDAFDLSLAENDMKLDPESGLIGYLDQTARENAGGVTSQEKAQAVMLAQVFNKPEVVEAYKKAVATDILKEGENNVSPVLEDFGTNVPSIQDKLKIAKALDLKMPEEAKRRSTSSRTVAPPMSAQTTRPRSTTPKTSAGSSSTKPSKPKAIAIIDAIDKNANKTKFDATREFGDYEKEFPKHEVDGMMGRDSADLPKMREQMKKVIKMAQASGIRERDIISLSDGDLQQIWSTLNAKKDPETRAQFLLMMLADFELGMRKLSAERAKNGPAQYEDAAKVKQIVDYMKKKGRV